MADQANETTGGALPGRATRIRVLGQLICRLVLHAPWTWPLLRGPVSAFFDDLAEGWDGRTGAGGVEHLAALARAVLEVRPEPERILDIASGTGEVALFLAREFPRARVRGIDLSEQMVRIAKAKSGLDPEGRIAFRLGDASALPYEEDSFDLVCQVDAPVFVAEISRVLRSGGSLVVVSSRGDRTPFHTKPASLARVLRRSGYEIVAQGVAGPGSFLVAQKLR